MPELQLDRVLPIPRRFRRFTSGLVVLAALTMFSASYGLAQESATSKEDEQESARYAELFKKGMTFDEARREVERVCQVTGDRATRFKCVSVMLQISDAASRWFPFGLARRSLQSRLAALSAGFCRNIKPVTVPN